MMSIRAGGKSQGRLPAFVFFTTGVLLVFASRMGVILTACVAGFLAPDGEISGPFLEKLADRQAGLGVCMMGAGVLMAVPAAMWRRLFRPLFNSPRPRFLAGLGLAALALCLLVQVRLFDNLPHVTDATCHYFQGQTYASGNLFAEVPPCPDAFYQHNMKMTTDGRWFSRYPPGTAILLAAGWVVGMPWLVVPLLQALSVMVLFLLVREFTSEMEARLAALLYAVSPLALLLGASFMSHTPFMFFALLGLLLFVRGFRARTGQGGGGGRLAMAGGLVLGCSILLRPQDTVAAVLCAGAAALWMDRRSWKQVSQLLPAAAAGGLVPVLLFMLYNYGLYGNLLSTGYGFEDENALQKGIAVKYGFGPGFGFADAVRNSINLAAKFNGALVGWPVSVLFAVGMLFRGGCRRVTGACVSTVLVVFFFFFFYSYPPYEYEARFWILMVPAWMVLSGGGLLRLLERPRLKTWTSGALAASALYALLVYWPGAIAPVYADDYEQVTAGLHERAVTELELPALVLIDSTGDHDFRYSSGFVFNTPRLDGPVIYARLGDKERMACLSEAYPGRRLYRFLPGEPWSEGVFEPVTTR